MASAREYWILVGEGFCENTACHMKQETDDLKTAKGGNITQ